MQKSNWSVIVPAAGRGSRLGGALKLYLNVGGRPIIDYMYDQLKGCERFVFVLSPQGMQHIQEQGLLLPGPAVLQAQPTGMAGAVGLALTQVETEFVCVVWGDQLLTPGTLVDSGMTDVEDGGNDMCCPITLVERPYTHMCRIGGRILSVLQAREGDELPLVGESDLGIFFFRTKALRDALHLLSGVGAITKENNFLPVLPLFASQKSLLRHPSESMGINTPEDMAMAEEVLRCLVR